jgi:hypothetical protein
VLLTQSRTACARNEVWPSKYFGSSAVTCQPAGRRMNKCLVKATLPKRSRDRRSTIIFPYSVVNHGALEQFVSDSCMVISARYMHWHVCSKIKVSSYSP